jgi:REP element-mobilizing transposase RayT
MPQSLAHVLIHTIFSTKNRQPFIDDNIAPELYDYLGGTCHKLGCTPLKVGGYNDHIHILCGLSRTIAIMDLMEEVKKRSSKWIKGKSEQYNGFYWQDGYAVFSVNPTQAPAVIRYIETQREHHSQMSFQDECRGFFRKYKVEWDERYVWD